MHFWTPGRQKIDLLSLGLISPRMESSTLSIEEKKKEARKIYNARYYRKTHVSVRKLKEERKNLPITSSLLHLKSYTMESSNK